MKKKEKEKSPHVTDMSRIPLPILAEREYVGNPTGHRVMTVMIKYCLYWGELWSTTV